MTLLCSEGTADGPEYFLAENAAAFEMFKRLSLAVRGLEEIDEWGGWTCGVDADEISDEYDEVEDFVADLLIDGKMIATVNQLSPFIKSLNQVSRIINTIS